MWPVAIGMPCWRVVLGLIFVIVGPQAKAADLQPVELELVLAVDVSSSVDATEFRLQMHGLSQAFRHQDVVNAIAGSGQHGIAVTLVQWSGTNFHRTSVGWALLRGPDGAARFADAIDAAPRLMRGFTDIGGGILYSLAQIETNRFDGRRKVIDVSGDGSSTQSNPGLERDRAVARGVTVNAVAILNEDPDLAEIGLAAYYRAFVTGGDGAFLMTAENFKDFAQVIKKKLLREITGPGVAATQPSLWSTRVVAR